MNEKLHDNERKDRRMKTMQDVEEPYEKVVGLVSEQDSKRKRTGIACGKDMKDESERSERS